MMGPEAALVAARLADMRRLGGYVSDLPPAAVPMYAEAAARARLAPPDDRPGAWARLRAAFRGRTAPRRDPASWTVAAAPIVANEGRPGPAPERTRAEALLAALPLQPVADH